MSYLHIAQKNSIAKQVANVLSNGSRRTGYTKSKFNPVFQFTMDGNQHRFSSVRGHIFQYQLPQQCKSWATYDNKKILSRDVQINKKYGHDMQSLVENLQDLARKSRHLVLWLDCDRQGEAIAYEVIEICIAVNPRLTIKRARFSAVTRVDIMQAINNLVLPNQRQSNAVSYRMQIDFRLGCTFTRYQTLVFRQKYQTKDKGILSYGPCQLPTLGFVVQRYLEIKYFVSENYYFLTAKCVLQNDICVDFKWTKKNTRDQTAIYLILTGVYQRAGGNGNIKGKVLKRSKNVKKRYRPYPLTTVELQKIATDKLKMSSAKVMQVAEHLYQKGYISYPRTQTNSFPKTMNLKGLIEHLRPNNEYNSYIHGLLDQNAYIHPKTGNSNDQAHSPIHPVKNATKQNLTFEEWKVYDLVSRHFLACCSKDAVGEEYQVLADISGEQFKASYLTIKELNFLQIYPYQKWASTTLAGNIPDVFDALVDIGQEKTKPPAYLSESNLIDMMQKNHIGTDSTIHEHIQTIQKRSYAIKSQNTLKPTSLGASLIIAYRNLGLRIAQCDIRRMMQINMSKIANGQINYLRAAQQTLNIIVPIYDDLMRKKNVWLEEITRAMEQHSNLVGIQMQQDRDQPANSNGGFNHYGSGGNGDNQGGNGGPGYNNARNGNNSNSTGYASNASNNRNNNHNNNSNTNSRPNQSNNNNYGNSNSLDNITCYACNQRGHFANNCPKKGGGGTAANNNNRSRTIQQPVQQRGKKGAQVMQSTLNSYASKKKSSSFQRQGNGFERQPAGHNRQPNHYGNLASSPVKCYRCQQTGHYAPNCPNLNINNKQKKQPKNGYNKNAFTKTNYKKNTSASSNSSSQYNHQKKTKVCYQCGHQGRHPKNSSCSTIKRSNKQGNQGSIDFL